MQYIEPFYSWQGQYDAASDRRSPFFGRKYHESLCTHAIYNFYIHPQWDTIGSNTLYVKLLYTDYDLHFCVVELMGEWNDCLYNDIMYLKRNFADTLIDQGIDKFILIAENVLNFHASENDYYQEWAEDTEGGWIALVNAREHIVSEFQKIWTDSFLMMGGVMNQIIWRPLQPVQLLQQIESIRRSSLKTTL